MRTLLQALGASAIAGAVLPTLIAIIWATSIGSFGLFGEPDQEGNYVLDIGGRKAKVYSKHGNTWTVEAENQRIYSRIITKIQIEG